MFWVALITLFNNSLNLLRLISGLVYQDIVKETYAYILAHLDRL